MQAHATVPRPDRHVSGSDDIESIAKLTTTAPDLLNTHAIDLCSFPNRINDELPDATLPSASTAPAPSAAPSSASGSRLRAASASASAFFAPFSSFRFSQTSSPPSFLFSPSSSLSPSPLPPKAQLHDAKPLPPPLQEARPGRAGGQVSPEAGPAHTIRNLCSRSMMPRCLGRGLATYWC